MRTAAVLPVKRLAAAKQRLGRSISDPLRTRLAQAMLSDVLAALAQARTLQRTFVVTCEPFAADEARAHGALVLKDVAEAGQSTAVMIGIACALAEGFERVLCVPGDCPALLPAELDRLLAAPAPAGTGLAGAASGADPAEGEVVIVPDRHGTGTNGLLLSPPDVIAPSFGPDSCERHRALAQAAGVVWRMEHPASLLLDIDTGEDLAALADRLAASSASAPRTRAVLGQPEPHPILSLSTAG